MAEMNDTAVFAKNVTMEESIIPEFELIENLAMKDE